MHHFDVWPHVGNLLDDLLHEVIVKPDGLCLVRLIGELSSIVGLQNARWPDQREDVEQCERHRSCTTT